jgi:hypothetical protein
MKIYQLSLEEQEMYFDLKLQLGIDKAREYLKKKDSASSTILSLVPLFYSLAIASQGISIFANGLGKVMGKEERNKIRNLKRRGLTVIQIVDKKSEETYHLTKGLDRNLKLFLKLNPKWRLTKEVYSGINTGKYILTRNYRRYNRKRDEYNEVCSECNRSYEDD